MPIQAAVVVNFTGCGSGTYLVQFEVSGPVFYRRLFMENAKMRELTIYTLLFCLIGCLSSGAVYAEEPNPGRFYEIAVEKVEHDGRDAVLITVTGKQGYHINIDYPWKLTLQAEDGLVVEKYHYLGADAELLAEERAVFRIPYRAKRDLTVKANLRLAVCRDVRCVFDDVVLAWSAEAGQ